jgi:hypothetical protein
LKRERWDEEEPQEQIEYYRTEEQRQPIKEERDM